ncbi:MAG: hypothetical protein JW888_13555 [Pirellulales bacterium]|nr:hypothetical protein [Pirellulales bacterium]
MRFFLTARCRRECPEFDDGTRKMATRQTAANALQAGEVQKNHVGGERTIMRRWPGI